MYFFMSVLIKLFLGLDFTIPCLWRMAFGFECPGCGLTTAFIACLKLNFERAFNINPLIFIVIPAALIYIVKDISHFKNNIFILS